MSDKGLVVAVNASPHAGIGNTAMMLEMFRGPLAEAGFELEVINLSEKRIEYCLGCGLCLEKGKCWRGDDHAGVVQRLLEADGIILACPVYFMSVTGQMKTFLDRSLAYGHKPRPTWKPGLAVSVAAAFGETTVGEYLATLLRVFGAFSVGTLTALAAKPGEFLGKEAVETRAADLARDLARAIKEKRRYPGTEKDLFFYLLMGDLVRRERDLMKDDYKHWEEHGFYQGFKNYVRQEFAGGQFDPNVRRAWIENMIAEEKAKSRLGKRAEKPAGGGPDEARTCRELLEIMPLGFQPEAAGDLKAVYQFEISGAENFTAHLKIEDGKCVFHEGPALNPSVVVKSPTDVWLGISKGEISGQSAFMNGQYKVEGDLSLLLKLNHLFKRQSSG